MNYLQPPSVTERETARVKVDRYIKLQGDLCEAHNDDACVLFKAALNDRAQLVASEEQNLAIRAQLDH